MVHGNFSEYSLKKSKNTTTCFLFWMFKLPWIFRLRWHDSQCLCPCTPSDTYTHIHVQAYSTYSDT